MENCSVHLHIKNPPKTIRNLIFTVPTFIAPAVFMYHGIDRQFFWPSLFNHLSQSSPCQFGDVPSPRHNTKGNDAAYYCIVDHDQQRSASTKTSPLPPYTLPCGPHGLTFTWWGCCGLCHWHKPAELAHSFLFCSCVCFCLNAPFNWISFHKFSLQLSIFSLCSSGLISALWVLSTICLCMKVSLSPDIILYGWLGLKHQLTNLLTVWKGKERVFKMYYREREHLGWCSVFRLTPRKRLCNENNEKKGINEREIKIAIKRLNMDERETSRERLRERKKSLHCKRHFSNESIH